MPLVASPAVLRAVDILETLAAEPSEAMTVSEVARILDMPRASCHTVLLALAERGYAVRGDGDLRYRLGPACIAVGDAARSINSALAVTGHEAEALAKETGTCVGVSVRAGDEIRVVEVFDHGPPFVVRGHLGQAIRLAPPFGAGFVAWADEAGVEAWLDAASAPLNRAARARYRAALEAIRTRGYSVTVATPRSPELHDALATLANTPDAEEARRVRDEVVVELTHSEYLPTDLDADRPVRMLQCSAPVFDVLGKVVAKIMVFGPAYDLTAGEVEALGEQLRAATERATRNIGGRPRGGG
ncbi:IclR family transcriptional regulator [Streptodolium elevatio]|uniref:Helix-turn-helix domain-containing protein n=1 Tax=Streptodolium elevatio TaxID=3157996 RepID=A0ABV3DQH5_9ACTN